MFKISSKNISFFKSFPVLLILIFNCFSSELDIKNMETVITGEHPSLTGFIQNLQVAPFNRNLLSFEVNNDDDPTIKLFLYNVDTGNLIQIESSNFSESRSSRRRYYIKDRGLKWHPYKNWFVFYGNGYMNRDQVYICRIIVPELINNYAVDGYRVILKENLKEERSFLRDPSFDMTGENLFFARRMEKRDRQARYNKTYNITGIQNIFDYRDKKFRGVDFKTVIDKRFHQINPVPSPSDKDVLAYTSFKNQEKRGEDYYAEYSINLINLRTSETTVVDNLDGYQDYPFFWSNTGSSLFYFKALSLLRTPQKFIDDKVNQINLHFVKVEKEGNSISVLNQSNPTTDILLEDVVAKEGWISFINDDNIIVSKYDPYASLFLVDINLWRNVDKDYANKLVFNKDIDTENPVILESVLYFISVEYLKTKTVSSIQASEFDLKLSGEGVRDLASAKSEMDSEEITGGEEDVYYEDDSFDDSDVFDSDDLIQKEDVEDLKIAELEKELNDLKVKKLEIDNEILTEENNVESLENEIRTLVSESNDLLDQKNLHLAKINSIRLEQTKTIQKLQQLALKEAELIKLQAENDKLDSDIENLLETLESNEKEVADLQNDLDSKNKELADINRRINDLRIQKTNAMETENQLASFTSQLEELKVKESSIQSDIDKSTEELASLNSELEEFEMRLEEKKSEKEKLERSVGQLKSDKLLTMKKDRESQLKILEDNLADLRSDSTKIESDINEMTESMAKENKSITQMMDKVKELNNEKLSLLNSLKEIRDKKAKQMEEAVAQESSVTDTEESADEEYVDEYEDEYQDEDEYYDEDFTVDEDIFEDIETSSSRRRGRR